MRRLLLRYYCRIPWFILAFNFILAALAMPSVSASNIYQQLQWPFYDPGSGINCSVSSASPASTSGTATVVLDPGHGSNFTATDSQTGLTMVESYNVPEVTEVWNVAQKVKTKLQSDGYNVLLTKNDIEGQGLTFRDKANIANNAQAAIAVSIHDDHGQSYSSFKQIYPQEVGAYRGTGSNKTVFDNSAVAQKSRDYSKIFQSERQKAEGGSPVVVLNSFDGRAPLEPGNIPMVQLFATVPWVYNEVGANGDLSQDQQDKYAAGMINAIEKAVPLSGKSPTTGGSNLDYAGRPILNQGQLVALASNTPTYQQAAQQAEIPWQVLVAMHYREHSLALDEPNIPGALGVYQITDNPENRKNLTMSAYPSPGATLTQPQFLQQSIDAANFIKRKEPGIVGQPSPQTIKKALALYNGLPELYKQQAANLGFGDQVFEGSPYVMNIADANRDPAVVVPGSWLQSFGVGDPRPATSDQYGAYVVYASVSGLTTGGGDCSSGSINCSAASVAGGQTVQNLSQVRQNIVCVAEQELALWKSGSMKPGKDFYKYLGEGYRGTGEDWCADFTSWVYNQAGYPFGPAQSAGPDWRIPYVGNFLVPPQDNSKFVYHPASSYTPKPGDLALHYNSAKNPAYTHVNIVVSVSPGEIILIGGNQGGTGNFETNKVSNDFISSPTGSDIIGYVGPD